MLNWPTTIHKLLGEADSLLTSRKTPWVIIGVGILLRLASYLHNPSMWRDEISLASNILNGSLSEFLQPLKHNQAAPVAFLILEKLSVQAFGDSDYALRVIPLAAGVLSLFLFYLVAKRCLTPVAAVIALSLFAVGGKLIYYSSEVKQYSTDVAVAILLLLVSINVISRKLSWQRAALFGVLGAAAVWFSHPSIFVLAGVGTMLLLFYTKEKQWSNVAFVSLAGSMWLTSFLLCYFVVLRSTASSSYLQDYWSSYEGFMPLPPRSFADVGWFVRSFFGAFENPGGFYLPVIAGLTFLVGCVSAFALRKRYLLLILSPLPLALLASGLHEYPVLGRTLLFAVPSFSIVIAQGIVSISRRASLAAVALAGLLLFHPIVNAAYTAVIRDETRADIKPSLRYISSHWQQGDVLYVFYAARRQFGYYARQYGIDEDKYIDGTKPPDELSKDVARVRGNRVWLLFLADTPKEFDERRFLVDQLDKAGTRLNLFPFGKVAAYLYDLREEPTNSH